MTAQVSERLLYQGEAVRMCTQPLQDYFAMGGRNPGFKAIWTSNWRGYEGTWELVDGRLYLVKLVGTLNDGREASLASVFPGFADRVFAHWYSGTVRLARGKMLRYVHAGYASVYEWDEFLEFDQGVLRRSWVRHNDAQAS